MTDTLIKVENVSKIFCHSLKRSLWYGVQDLSRERVGRYPGPRVGLAVTMQFCALNCPLFWTPAFGGGLGSNRGLSSIFLRCGSRSPIKKPIHGRWCDEKRQVESGCEEVQTRIGEFVFIKNNKLRISSQLQQGWHTYR